MRGFRSILVAALPFMLVCTAVLPAAAQSNGNAVQAEQKLQSETPNHLFAIIGQIARPGVYRAPLSEPYLVDLIHNAGGFSDKANGFVRIVRQTPGGPQSFYATGHDFQLRVGDVVIVGEERKPKIAPQTTDPVAQKTDGTKSEASQEFAGQVQLAFVNLTSQPIVLKMREENASVGRILELLGHSADLASSVKVIAPGETPVPTPASLQLASESVLVFDPAVIQADRLPVLPTQIANDTRQSQETITTVHSESSDDTSHQLQFAVTSPDTSPEVPPPLDLEPPSLTAKTLPELAKHDTAELSEPLPAVAQLPPQLATVAKPFAADPLSPPKEPDAEVDATNWWSALTYCFLFLSTCLATVWGIVRGRRSRRRSLKLPKASSEFVELDDLDEIIYDNLPVVEEPVSKSTLPPGLAGVVSRNEQNRVDAVHRTPRPHFLPDNSARPAYKPVVATAETASAGSKNFRVDEQHEPEAVQPVTAPVNRRSTPSTPQGLLDRVLSHVQGASTR